MGVPVGWFEIVDINRPKAFVALPPSMMAVWMRRSRAHTIFSIASIAFVQAPSTGRGRAYSCRPRAIAPSRAAASAGFRSGPSCSIVGASIDRRGRSDNGNSATTQVACHVNLAIHNSTPICRVVVPEEGGDPCHDRRRGQMDQEVATVGDHTRFSSLKAESCGCLRYHRYPIAGRSRLSRLPASLCNGRKRPSYMLPLTPCAGHNGQRAEDPVSRHWCPNWCHSRERRRDEVGVVGVKQVHANASQVALRAGLTYLLSPYFTLPHIEPNSATPKW